MSDSATDTATADDEAPETESQTDALRRFASSRHPGVASAARWLEVSPSLPGHLRGVASGFERLALQLLAWIVADDPQLTHALNYLRIAKDHAVTARIADRVSRGLDP